MQNIGGRCGKSVGGISDGDERQRIAMLGGTFNPIHNGHLFLAKKFYELLKLDRVLLMPTRIPPHKQPKNLATGEQRMAMCRLAARSYGFIQACDMELKRRGKSYTADTLRELEGLYPQAKLYLITGADMFLTLQGWWKYPEIIAKAVICAAPRNDSDAAALHRHAEKIRRDGGQTVILEQRPPDISSTEIRRRSAAGESLEGLLPPAVAGYIREQRLYEAGDGNDV